MPDLNLSEALKAPIQELLQPELGVFSAGVPAIALDSQNLSTGTGLNVTIADQPTEKSYNLYQFRITLRQRDLTAAGAAKFKAAIDKMQDWFPIAKEISVPPVAGVALSSTFFIDVPVIFTGDAIANFSGGRFPTIGTPGIPPTHPAAFVLSTHPTQNGQSPTFKRLTIEYLQHLIGDSQGTIAAGDDPRFAENWRYPGSTLVDTLTGVGLEQRKSDRSVWENGKIVQTRSMSARELVDRKVGIIRNGACNFPAVPDKDGILRAENWQDVVAYPADALTGEYSLAFSAGRTWDLRGCTELSAVVPGALYGVLAAAKQRSPIAGSKWFPIVYQFDADKLPINIYNRGFDLATRSALAAPLRVGDRTVRIAKGTAAQWGLNAWKALAIFPYANSFGRIYPTPSSETPTMAYSQYVARLGETAIVETTATEYIVTLPSGWAYPNPAVGSSGVWGVGTEVCESYAGDGNRVYPYGTNVPYVEGRWSAVKPNGGTKQGLFCLTETNIDGVMKLYPGTQFITVGVQTWVEPTAPSITDTLFHVNVIESFSF